MLKFTFKNTPILYEKCVCTIAGYGSFVVCPDTSIEEFILFLHSVIETGEPHDENFLRVYDE